MEKIRPFQLPQDIDRMVSLLDNGFQYPENPEWSAQSDEEENLQDQVKSIKSIWPLIRVLQTFVPFLRDLMLGYIYEEDNKPVGLINFGRQKNIPEWFVGNVTVLPEYRRRGIARKLVEIALDELRARDAEIATLEVISENLPAIRLYEEMGFVAYRGTSDYEILLEKEFPTLSLENGYSLKKLGANEWQTRMAFAQRVTPPKIKAYEPVRKDRFQTSPVINLIKNLMNVLNGSKTEQFAIIKGEQVVAIGTYHYRTRTGGVNRANIQLDPACSEIAPFMFSYLLASVQSASPGRRLEIQLQNWQPALLRAAKAIGCKERFSYQHMAMRFS